MPAQAEQEKKQVEKPVVLTAEVREKLLETHPIVEREYTLPTPMLERTYDVVRERIWTKRTGICFYGAPRLGKSTCLREMQELILSEFKRVCVTCVSARRGSPNSQSHMYTLILEAESHILAGRKDPNALFRNVLSDIQMRLTSRNGNHFVLLIDEMQLLSGNELEQLLAVHNALNGERIKMTTISFAQPEILHHITAYTTKQQFQLIARFLSEPLPFEGCNSSDELYTLLEAYDEKSEYPEGSGWSYTRFFLPRAFGNGFRLKDYNKVIWDTLIASIGPQHSGSIPMEHLCISIEDLLLRARGNDSMNFHLSEEDITLSTEASNLHLYKSSHKNSIE